MKLIVNTLDYFEKTDGIVAKYIPEYYNRLAFDIDKKVNDGAFVSISFDDDVTIMSLLKLLIESRVAFILIEFACDVDSRIVKRDMAMIEDYLELCNYDKLYILSDNMCCYGALNRGLVYG